MASLLRFCPCSALPSSAFISNGLRLGDSERRRISFKSRCQKGKAEARRKMPLAALKGEQQNNPSSPGLDTSGIERRQAVLGGLVAALFLPSTANPAFSLPSGSLETTSLATVPTVQVDEINAYSCLYPVGGQEIQRLRWLESRTPERYSSAAQFSPDARQRIVSERLNIKNNLVVSVSVDPPDTSFLKDSDPSASDAKDVARSVLTATQGRVGTCKREGNVSMASFGIKMKKYKKGKKGDVSKSLSKMLPFIVAGTALAALVQPASFTWVSKDYYAPALGGIMLSIGVQLSVSDFALVAQRPLPVLIGYTGQYMVKPLLGFMIVKLFNVPAAFAPGLILTSCVAGAQLSSYAAFLSEGDVALSIVLTSLTTMSSVAITPLLTRIFIGSVVPVDIGAMAKSILQVVIVPVFLGLALNTYAKPAVDKVRSLLPLVAMFCTSLCIGSPLALNRARIMSMEGLLLMFPVLAFHIGAFVVGYGISKVPLWSLEDKEARTISLCTGMQSSTLAMLLASQFLGATNAVSPACSVVVMALMGLSLASFWGKGNRVRDLVPTFVTVDNTGLGVI